MARTLVFGNNCCMVCTTGHTIFKADIWLNGFLATVSYKLILEYNGSDKHALWRDWWPFLFSIKLGANLNSTSTISKNLKVQTYKWKSKDEKLLVKI